MSRNECFRRNLHITVEEEREYVKRIKWDDGKPLYASLYVCPFDSNRVLDLSRLQSEKGKTKFDQNDEIKVRKNIADYIIPLLY